MRILDHICSIFNYFCISKTVEELVEENKKRLETFIKRKEYGYDNNNISTVLNGNYKIYAHLRIDYDTMKIGRLKHLVKIVKKYVLDILYTITYSFAFGYSYFDILCSFDNELDFETLIEEINLNKYKIIYFNKFYNENEIPNIFR